MRDKVTRQCPQTTTFEEKGESKQIRNEVPLLTSLKALPLGQTGSRALPLLPSVLVPQFGTLMAPCHLISLAVCPCTPVRYFDGTLSPYLSCCLSSYPPSRSLPSSSHRLYQASSLNVLVHDPFNTRLQLSGIRCH